MATQADWRMILGIKQQPNQWVQALQALPQNIVQGLQIGDYMRERSEENQLRELMRGAIDPQTGLPDQGKMIQAVITAYPEKAPALMAEMRKQAQNEKSQAALQQFLERYSEGGLATPPSVRALAVAGAGGQPEKALENLAAFENQWALAERNRQQDLISGIDEFGRPVSRTREEWMASRSAPAPGSAASPSNPASGGMPATSPTPSNYEATANGLLDRLVTAESGGRHYGNGGKLLESPKGAQGITQIMPTTGRDPGYGVTPIRNTSQQEFLRFGRDYLTAMLKEFDGDPRKAFAAYNAGPDAVKYAVQRYGADWERGLPQETRAYLQKTTGPLGGATLEAATPVRGIRTGLSEGERQQIKIAEENRANKEMRERAALDYERGAPERAFNKENQLRDEFNASLKEYGIMRDKYGSMLEAMRVAKTAPDGQTKGASDITLIYSFMKVLDPTSVVREGEYATAANAGGVPDKILNYYNKVLQGDQLPDSVRDAIMNQGDLLYKRAKQGAITSQKRYSALATQSGVNPENVVYDIEGKSLPSVADFMKQLEAEKANTASKPAAAEKANKVGTQQDVLAVAKKLNISPDAAMQRLKAAGWSIQ